MFHFFVFLYKLPFILLFNLLCIILTCVVFWSTNLWLVFVGSVFPIIILKTTKSACLRLLPLDARFTFYLFEEEKKSRFKASFVPHCFKYCFALKTYRKLDPYADMIPIWYVNWAVSVNSFDKLALIIAIRLIPIGIQT